MEPSFSELAGGLDHPECAAWGPDGYVYAGGEAGQIYRSDSGQHGGDREHGRFIFGLALDADANVHACYFGKGEIAAGVIPGRLAATSRRRRASQAR